MVYDKLTNLINYLPEETYARIEPFLKSINENMEEKRYEISGDSIYARVMSYSTPEPSGCKIEAHNKYIDIQASIVGAEGISIFERNKLTERQPYSEEKDVVLFDYNEEALRVHTINVAGYFTMLFPEDAHRPQEFVDGYGSVKKFVIKVRIQ